MNEEKFSGRAELYALSRPSYAQGAIGLIGGMVPRGTVKYGLRRVKYFPFRKM